MPNYGVQTADLKDKNRLLANRDSLGEEVSFCYFQLCDLDDRIYKQKWAFTEIIYRR